MRVALMLFACTLTASAQWQLQDSHTAADLRGIDNVCNRVAWASGSNGTVLRTTDNGTTWQRCTTPPDADKLDFRGIQAFDANTAIVMSSGKGDLSRLYKTTDGCQTWKLVLRNSDAQGFWDALRFNKASPKHGSLIGDPVDGAFVIYTSSDEGSTWLRWSSESFTPPVAAKRNESLFAASNSASGGKNLGGVFSFVTGGASGSRFITITFGESAKHGLNKLGLLAEDLPFTKRDSSGAFSIGESTDQSLMIVGGDYANPNQHSPAVYSPNGTGLKRRSTLSSTGDTNGYRSAVAYDAATKTWITVGPNGTDISTDDGRNWRALKPSTEDAPDADKNWNALSLPFVVGPKGRIGVLEAGSLRTK